MGQHISTFFRRHWRGILTTITFLALGGFVYALRHQISDTIRNLEEVNLWILLAMAPFQFGHYHFVALLYRSLFRILGNRVAYRFLYRTGLELNFVNLVFPSAGVSGFSYFGIRMRTQHVSTGKATLVQTMRFVLLFIAFQVLLFVGLLLLSLSGRASNFMILIASSLATLLLVGTLGLTFVIGSEKRIDAFFTFLTRVLNKLIQLVRPNHPETISVERAQSAFRDYHGSYKILRTNYRKMLKPLIYALFINLTEIATIYTVFAAFGQWINPGAVIIAYAVANFAGLVSVLPGGIGIYEALMTGVLAAGGVPAALSLPVIVAYRILNIGLQLPFGAYMYHLALNEKEHNAG
jgi:glycosyltransferase 2 family protein